MRNRSRSSIQRITHVAWVDVPARICWLIEINRSRREGGPQRIGLPNVSLHSCAPRTLAPILRKDHLAWRDALQRGLARSDRNSRGARHCRREDCKGADHCQSFCVDHRSILSGFYTPPVTPAAARPFADDQNNETAAAYTRQKPVLRECKDLKLRMGLP